MNRHFAFLRNEIILSPPVIVDEPKKANVRNKYDEILDQIYSLDPVTGNPRGDLAVFLSADAHPEIRDFIQRNLLMDLGDNGESNLVLPDSVRNQFSRFVTDDDIASLSRNRGESMDEYAQRLSECVRDMKLAYRRQRETARLNAKLRQKND